MAVEVPATVDLLTTVEVSSWDSPLSALCATSGGRAFRHPQWLYRERGRRADPPLATSQCYSAARASTVSTFGGGVCRQACSDRFFLGTLVETP